MKTTQEQQPLFAEERQDQIISLLNQHNKLLVSELCDYFKVSPATIRNDLRDLSAQGRLKRTHGGAIPITKAAFEPTSADKDVIQADNKKRIAALAAESVEDGDTIALDAGSTMLEFSKLLCDKKSLTIVTNDIRIAAYLEANSTHTIIMLAGTLRHGLQCVVGPLTIHTMNSLNVDKAFIATNAFHPDKGFTTPDINQAEVKKAFLRSSSHSTVLCDSSKMNGICFMEFAQLHDIDRLITDSGLPARTRQYLEEQKELVDILYA